jgi:hypothetical protein
MTIAALIDGLVNIVLFAVPALILAWVDRRPEEQP